MAFKVEDESLLIQHLQALIDVELFTIPFYLTAANSVRTSVASDDPARTFQSLAVSVAVQEMYHLQQACNIANAFGVTPQFPKLSLDSTQKILVPHLDPNNQAFYVQLGNLPEAIQAMLQIETADTSPEPVVPNTSVTYRSISDLYTATLQLLALYWTEYANLPAQLDPHFTPNNNQIGYGAFPSRFTYNTIAQRSDVLNSINAITDQGEGDIVAPADLPLQYGSDGNILPQYQGSQSDRFYSQDKITHYQRFLTIQQGIEGDLSAYYQANGAVAPDLPPWAANISLQTLQGAVNTIWSFLIDTLESGFASGNLPANNQAQPQYPGFNSAMISFKYLLPLIWQHGACPSFFYTPGVTGQQVQAAMDAVDPWCLFHWDQTTATLRNQHPNELNACQGLNSCKGLGWGGIATQAGDGACSTADPHTCVGSNSCTRQGGCGFLSDDSNNNPLPLAEQWVPGQNTGASSGGCQTPIATRQVFHNYGSGLPADLQSLAPLEGTSVWERARNLMAQKLKVQPAQLPTPVSQQVGTINYDGTQRRTNVTPSST